jgi:hypothetical protein
VDKPSEYISEGRPFRRKSDYSSLSSVLSSESDWASSDFPPAWTFDLDVVRVWLGFESSVPGVQGFDADFDSSSVLASVSALYWDGCVWLGCVLLVPEVHVLDVDCEVLSLFIPVLSLDWVVRFWLGCELTVPEVHVFDVDCEVLSLFIPDWDVPV